MTKEQLVEALRKNVDENPCQFACEECNEADCFTPVLRTAADLIEQQTAKIAELEAKAPRWIPVNERLPKTAGSYIVCTKSGSVVKVNFYPEFGRFQRIFTHWMPLPETPKEV